MNSNSLIHLLQGRGHRMTTARRLMISALCESSSPLSAADLIKNLHSRRIKSNKTTVYRELAFLSTQNIVTAIDFGDGTKRYEIAGEHHHHLICSKCSQVEDIELERDVEEEGLRLGKEKGFMVTGHSLEFFGKCRNCH